MTTSIPPTALNSRTLANVEIFLLAPAESNPLNWAASFVGTRLDDSKAITVGKTKIEASVASVTTTGAVTGFTCRVTSGTFTKLSPVFLGCPIDGNNCVGSRTTEIPIVGTDVSMTLLAPDVNDAANDDLKKRATNKAKEAGVNGCVSVGATEGDDFLLASKKYQRVVVILDGNRPSSLTPYTTTITVRGIKGDKTDKIPDTGRIPISMIVTTGPAIAKTSALRYSVMSSPHANSEACYIDCSASIEGWSDMTTTKKDEKYGWQWSSQVSVLF